MPVIYLDKHRHLTEKQKKMAEVALSNEINDVMANLEILEEEMDRTSVFGTRTAAWTKKSCSMYTGGISEKSKGG